MTVVRQDQPLPLEIEVVREEIRITSVRGRLLEPATASASRLQVETAADSRARCANSRTARCAGWCWTCAATRRAADLGGADRRRPAGGRRIVSTRGRHPISETEFTATPATCSTARRWVIVDAGPPARRKCWPALGEHGARGSSAAALSAGLGADGAAGQWRRGQASHARYYTRRRSIRPADRPGRGARTDSRPPTLVGDRSKPRCRGTWKRRGRPARRGAGDVLPGDARSTPWPN